MCITDKNLHQFITELLPPIHSYLASGISHKPHITGVMSLVVIKNTLIDKYLVWAQHSTHTISSDR